MGAPSRFPVIIKASAGGGGRGMRIVRSEEELPRCSGGAVGGGGGIRQWRSVHGEVRRAPRHIEFQILADEHGNVVSLGERECSIQRRHQKLLEESPSLQVTARVAQRNRQKC